MPYLIMLAIAITIVNELEHKGEETEKTTKRTRIKRKVKRAISSMDI